MIQTYISQKVLSHKQILSALDAYGLPLYLYNFDKIFQQFAKLQKYLPANFHIHYALKANSSLAICQQLADLDCKADISSLGELATALKAGFLPEQILFTGPGKNQQELSTALEVGCKLVVLESINEAQKLNDIARRKGIVQDVLIRINPLYRTSNSCEIRQLEGVARNGKKGTLDSIASRQLICTQGPSKFGVDEEKGAETMDAIMDMKNLNLKGIHIFTETNVVNYNELLLSWENTIDIANKFRSQGFPISIIDFGGGVGVAYSDTQSPFDIQKFGQRLQWIFDHNPYKYDCIVEIGRYLVAESGLYITEILDIKQSHGKTYVIIDGGIHQLFRNSMKEITKYLEVMNKPSKPTKKVTLAGKLPTPLDILVEDVLMPEDIEIGDKIVIYNCGSYGFNHSLTNFNMHPYPAEAAYKYGELNPIRLRGKVKDFWANQVFITSPNTL